ncbi:hypothetical protein CEXT_409721 [Caerostris extrusa]|uniref:Uncharacterized protein n=1 Tax=Caerostris extrusa TaxID=172846 RepID=A0AAV4SZL6_CAEEX|nr:hypothetical protein CEXT_409721 [Caerostris extrusa]
MFDLSLGLSGQRVYGKKMCSGAVRLAGWGSRINKQKQMEALNILMAEAIVSFGPEWEILSPSLNTTPQLDYW